MKHMVCSALTAILLVCPLVVLAESTRGYVPAAADVKSPLTWLKKAQSAADTIPNTRARAMALLRIAAPQVRAGDAAEAQKMLEAAKALLAGTGGPDLKAGPDYMAIARAYQQAGDPAAARQMWLEAKAAIASSPGSPAKAWLYPDIAAGLAKAGDNAADQIVEEAAKDAPDAKSRERIRSSYATALSREGEYAKAVAVAMSLGDLQSRTCTLCWISDIQRKAGDSAGARRTREDAVTVAAGIQDTDPKKVAYWNIVWCLAGAGDPDGAKASAALIPDIGLRTTAQENVVCAYVEAGDLAGAKAWADAIPDPIPDAYHRVGSYAEIVAGQIRAKDPAGARQTVEVMKTLVPTISRPKRRGWANINLARAEARLGDLAGVQQALQEASALVPDWNAVMRQDMYQEVAFARLEAGDAAGARAATELEVFAVPPIGEQYQAYVASHIAKAQALAGDLTNAMAAVAAIKDDPFRSEAILGIARAQSRAANFQGLVAWIDSLPTPDDCVTACIGAATGLLPAPKESTDPHDRWPVVMHFGGP